MSTTPFGSPVLPEVYWINAMSSRSMGTGSGSPRVLLQLGNGHDPAQAGRPCLQQTRHAARLGHGDEDRGFGVGQNARMAANMLLDLRQTRRRIDRHGDAAGSKDAEIRVEVFRAGGQHDRHRLARFQSCSLQPGGDDVDLPLQIADN